MNSFTNNITTINIELLLMNIEIFQFHFSVDSQVKKILEN